MTERCNVVYHLTPDRGENVRDKAEDITLEQTVELPAGLVPDAVAETMTGRVESLRPLDDDRWEATVSFPLACIGGDLTQFLNLLFGNISLKRGVHVEAVDWPPSLAQRFGGPGFGIPGLRQLLDVFGRAVLATALKPMGLSARDLARVCGDFALGGIDIIKDDHGLADQPAAPFDERVARCQEAVSEANARTGGNALYFPNVTAGFPEMAHRLETARARGCRGVLVNPWLTGLEALRWIRDEHGLATMAHPSLTGTCFQPGHGIAAELLLGDLFRVAGADAVIYPNAGGRFGFSTSLCERINARLRSSLHALRPSFPAAAGGIDVDRARYWVECYGPDTILLIGGSLYARGDLVAASRQLRQAITT